MLIWPAGHIFVSFCIFLMQLSRFFQIGSRPVIKLRERQAAAQIKFSVFNECLLVFSDWSTRLPVTQGS